jgi:anti-anti-sigma regulatory factor
MSFTRRDGPPSHMAPGPTTTVLSLGGPLAPADLPALCARGRALLESSGADVLVCDVGALAQADCLVVDAVARLQLTARRLGRRICVRHPSPELCALIAFTGLAEVCGLGPEFEREAEQREDSLGVQEEGELDDPPA